MSSVSQTRPRPQARLGGFGPRFALSMLAVAILVVAAIGPAGREIAAMAARARPHAPDWALLGSLPLAIQLHLGAALAALGLGAALMSVRKGRRFHRTAGWAWVGLVSLVAGSSLFITELNHGRLSILHIFTGWTLIVLPLAVMWAKRHEVARHRRTMMGLFYGGFAINLFIAFIPGRTMWQAFFG
jgi:uncharacterized membrane protein